MNVLVSGASMAGLTAAYWLRHHGFDVTVVERSSELRRSGAPIDVRGGALEVAAGMGLLERIRAAGVVRQGGLTFVGPDGEVTATLDGTAFNEAPDDVEVRREDLVDMLFDVARPGLDLRFATSVETLVDDGEGVQVTLTDGTAARFDAVVGADGLHSAVRRLAFGDESGFVHHLGLYVTLVDLDPSSGRPHEIQVFNSPGRMVSLANYGDHAYGMLVFRSPELAYDHRDLEQQRRLVLDAFATERAWEIPAILEQVRAAEDFYFDSVSQVRMDPWWRGRVALVGDAAHCAAFLSGMGTTLAMVGAAVLAEELAASPDDPGAAFARFDARHRPIVDPAQAGVPGNAAVLIPATAEAIEGRNGQLRAAARAG